MSWTDIGLIISHLCIRIEYMFLPCICIYAQWDPPLLLADTLKVTESDLGADALASFLAFLVVCSVKRYDTSPVRYKKLMPVCVSVFVCVQCKCVRCGVVCGMIKNLKVVWVTAGSSVLFYLVTEGRSDPYHIL